MRSFLMWNALRHPRVPLRALSAVPGISTLSHCHPPHRLLLQRPFAPHTTVGRHICDHKQHMVPFVTQITALPRSNRVMSSARHRCRTAISQCHWHRDSGTGMVQQEARTPATPDASSDRVTQGALSSESVTIQFLWAFFCAVKLGSGDSCVWKQRNTCARGKYRTLFPCLQNCAR